MKKGLIKSLILMIFLSSCSGLLWDVREGGDLTLSISNPFYQPGRSASSRALALQGQFLYIELARIDNQAEFNNDVGRVLTGDGNWVETDWGGYAIVTLGLSLSTSSETIDLTFKDVPRDKDLKARVLLVEEDEETFYNYLTTGYYGEVSPLCYSYNPDAPDLFEPVGFGSDRYDWMWIDLSKDEIISDLVTITIRPESFGGSISSLVISDDYTSASFTGPFSPGTTKFTVLNPDVSSLQINDVAYYTIVSGIISDPILQPSVTLLYDGNGKLVPNNSLSITGNAPTLSYRQVQIQKEKLVGYANSDYFISSSLIFNPVSTWWVYAGLVYDNAFDLTGLPIVSWTIPAGFQNGDLQFRVIETSEQGLSAADIDTIDEILNLGTFYHDSGWVSGISYNSSGGIIADGLARWVIILAKPNGSSDSEQFIFARYFDPMV